jgi:uncharacterized protein YbjT (DUF2867 family)
MRVLLIGATGLIGAAICGRLAAEGHEVVAVARRLSARTRSLPVADVVCLDLADADRKEVWLPNLDGVKAVINCAGVLQDGPGGSTDAVHARAVASLVAACEEAGIRRFLQISAIGVDREALTEFMRTKAEGERALMTSGLDWVVLRPSVVVGRAAFGGSALFRGLAALPIFPVPPETGPLQVVHLDDLVETVLFFLRADAPARQALDVAGPERLSFPEVVAQYRRWLGWRPARRITMPAVAFNVMFGLGDIAGWLGWRAPMRTTARKEVARGAVGDNEEWTRVTGIVPRSLAAALAAEPASVQERWFAQLYLLKPAVLGIFALFWIMTGVVSLTVGWNMGLALMIEGGAGGLAAPSVAAGALADIAIGVGILFRRTARHALYAALAISIFYIFAATAILPGLWADPLGPLMKIWPILALNFVALAILEER